MQYARASLPALPPGGMTAGIDWASTDHAVCVLDATGTVLSRLSRFIVEHTAAA